MKNRPTIRGRMQKGQGAAVYLQPVTPTVKKVLKSTVYFSPEVQQALEELWLSVRRADGKRATSRSDVISAAIERTSEQLKKLPPEKQVELLFSSGAGKIEAKVYGKRDLTKESLRNF